MLVERRRNSVFDCPFTAAHAAVGGKWKLLIVYWLCESPRHFAALRALMPAISTKVLAEQLRELAADGIVAREETGAAPAPVVYSLTHYGRTLEPLVEHVRTWGRTHIEHFTDGSRVNTSSLGTSEEARLGPRDSYES